MILYLLIGTGMNLSVGFRDRVRARRRYWLARRLVTNKGKYLLKVPMDSL